MNRRGQITTSEGAALTSMICGYSRTLEVAELSRRIDELEAAMAAVSDAITNVWLIVHPPH
jgi:hypothetical protein